MILANFTNINHQNLPSLQDGQSCISGKMYKNSCNTCRCGRNNSQICTKMACLEKVILNQMRTTKQHLRKGTKRQIKLNNKTKLENNVNVKQSKHSRHDNALPKLPSLPKGKCVPGKIYSKGCKKCFCTSKNTPICTTTCRKRTLLTNRLFDEDISALQMRTQHDLPELPHVGAECVPGRSYRVQCNTCFCSERRDLYCSLIYCVKEQSLSEFTLRKYNGQPCDKDFTKDCIRCLCKDKKSSCKLLKNCNKLITGKQLLSDNNSIVKLALDVKKDKCTPNVTYRAHCNDCYCQADGGLRCTQKVCLTFSQIKDLQKREAYLEKYGL